MASDKNKDPTAHDKFIKIAEAYEILSDTDKRNKYNKYFKKRQYKYKYKYK